MTIRLGYHTPWPIRNKQFDRPAYCILWQLFCDNASVNITTLGLTVHKVQSTIDKFVEILALWLSVLPSAHMPAMSVTTISYDSNQNLSAFFPDITAPNATLHLCCLHIQVHVHVHACMCMYVHGVSNYMY